MRVGLVEQQDRARIPVHVRQQQQRLLQASARRRQVEASVALPVGHRDLAALGDVARRVELHAEQAPDVVDQGFPGGRFLFVNPEAEITQHLGSAALADADVDGALIQPRLGGGQPRHRRQERDADRSRVIRHRYAARRPVLGPPQRPTVKRLLVRVVELQPARPAPVAAHALDDEFDADIAGPWPAVDALHVPHVQVPPQQVGVRNGNRHQIPPVDGHPLRFFRGTLAGPLLVPALEADVPQGQRLHGRGLPGVVGADEDHRAPELDLDLVEALEVADCELGQHSDLTEDLSALPDRCSILLNEPILLQGGAQCGNLDSGAQSPGPKSISSFPFSLVQVLRIQIAPLGCYKDQGIKSHGLRHAH